jgi:hypothetical protein
MKNAWVLIFLLLISFLIADGVQPVGAGTQVNPYQIETLDNLLWVSTTSSSWGSTFIQFADIDASDTATWNLGYGFVPIGNTTTSFTGSFDGQNHSISGLLINRVANNQALFGELSGATISDLGLTGCNITGVDKVGGIAAEMNTSTTITRCFTTGSITGQDMVGGIAGNIRGASTISQSYNTASITAFEYGGGIAGKNRGSSIIELCYNLGSVDDGTFLGGITGYNDSSLIHNCYNSGEISGVSYLGGLTGLDTPVANVTDSFWDIEASGCTFSEGGIGLTTEQMCTLSIYTGSGWDFIDETTNGTNDYWGMHFIENAGYPFLSFQSFTHYPPSEVVPAGLGTTASPYLVSNLDHLLWISTHSDSWDKVFSQTQDIDASGTLSLDGGNGFFPIGNGSEPFIGEYHGQSFSISNLYVSHADVQNQGLFGSIDFAILDQISISNCNVTGNNSTGGLSGHARRSTIESCSVSGNITGEIDCGGLVGKSQNSTILNCSSSAVVDGYDHTGGLLGNNTSSAHIEQCWSESVVNSYNRCGGLVGYNSDFGSISQCWSNSTVTLDGLFQVGGFVGLNTSNSTISQSYSHGTVNAVSGSSYMGGFTGGCYYDGTITDCYSTAAVGNQGTYRKGFCGSLYEGGQVVDCFWDIETSNYTSSAGATGLTTAEMQEYNTFVAAGWDLPDEDGNGTNDYWGMHPEANSGYPFLSWQGFEHLIYRSQQPIGAGTIASPYIISSIDNLGWVSLHEESWDSFFQQDQDIDATITQNWDSNTGFIAIGNEITPFTGVWSGQRNNVTNLTINKPTLNEQGLFGNVSEAQISGISLINCDVTGLYRVGGIAGYSRNSSVVEECFVTGTLSSFHTCGGIVGRNSDSSQINNCYSTAAVSGENNQGGITGRSDALSIVSNCYSFGTIAGIQSCGGIVGKNQNSLVEFSYSTGAVSGSSGVDVGGLIGYSGNQTGTTCFWNIDTSGQLVSAGGIGLNTQQMNEYTTYQTAGWDFVNETANGTDSYWNMDGVSNSGYPWLNWQEIDPVASQVPQNVAISTISNQVHLSWDALSAPVDFHVYSSDNPTTGFVLDTSGTFTSTTWIAPVTEQRKFYRITTDNSSRFMRSTSVRGDLQGHTRTDRD